MKTNLILGPPGTGKTTYLIKKLNSYIKSGFDPKKIAFISFTKAAINEAVSRLPYNKKDYIYFRTLHSLAFMEGNFKKGQVLSGKYVKDFEDIMGDKGVEVKYNFTEDTYDTVRSIPIYLNHIAENKLLPVEQIYNNGNYDVSLDTINHVLKSYKAFKNYFNLIDFNDMLKYDFKPIDNVKIVFLDEAQDLTPLQWETFFKFFKKVDTCYIAGDDCQAIYEWCGVDVNKFVNINYDNKITLKQSYRLPGKVFNLSSKIIDRITIKFDKEFKPNEKTGSVKNIVYLKELKEKLINEKDKSWLFLVRNNYLVNRIKEKLIDFGIYFIDRGENEVDQTDIKAIISWEKYRKTNEYNVNLLRNYTNSIDKSKTWYKAFLKMPPDKANYYRDLLRNGFNIREKPKIEITSIHRAKGREADNVVLLSDFSQSCQRLLDRGDESEHRVFYVGVTRAKENLYILEPETNNFYEF